jgi:hypothetical protein
MTERLPSETVIRLAMGHAAARCLHVVAKLGIADRIDSTPVSAAELAAGADADADALARILQLLEAHGVFARAGGGFVHTPASRLLRADHPKSLRALALMHGMEFFQQSFAQLEYSARTGKTGMSKAFPDGVFAYLRSHPEDSKVFNASMTAKSHQDNAAFVAAYDFSGARTVVDVGGGQGHLLRAVLDADPAIKGIVFDLPEGLPEHAASDRMTLQSGDFFKDALPRADLYVVSNVIHDWPDPEARTILSAIARAADAKSRVVLLEAVIPDGPEPHIAKTLDIVMLAVPGGRERTEREYRDLLAASGLKLTQIMPTASLRSIVEAVPA